MFEDKIKELEREQEIALSNDDYADAEWSEHDLKIIRKCQVEVEEKLQHLYNDLNSSIALANSFNVRIVVKVLKNRLKIFNQIFNRDSHLNGKENNDGLH